MTAGARSVPCHSVDDDDRQYDGARGHQLQGRMELLGGPSRAVRESSGRVRLGSSDFHDSTPRVHCSLQSQAAFALDSNVFERRLGNVIGAQIAEVRAACSAS